MDSHSPNPENEFPDDDASDVEDPLTTQLVAYLDGELDGAEIEELEAKLDHDPRARAKLDALKQTWALLDHLPRPEPSQRFTERTMDKIDLPAASGGKAKSTKTVSTRAIPGNAARAGKAKNLSSTGLTTKVSRPSSRSWAAVWAALLIVAGGAGYFLRPALVEPHPEVSLSDPKVEDWHMLRNLRLYQHVNDIQFLKDLDHPELFGEDSVGW